MTLQNSELDGSTVIITLSDSRPVEIVGLSERIVIPIPVSELSNLESGGISVEIRPGEKWCLGDEMCYFFVFHWLFQFRCTINCTKNCSCRKNLSFLIKSTNCSIVLNFEATKFLRFYSEYGQANHTKSCGYEDHFLLFSNFFLL